MGRIRGDLTADSAGENSSLMTFHMKMPRLLRGDKNKKIKQASRTLPVSSTTLLHHISVAQYPPNHARACKEINNGERTKRMEKVCVLRTLNLLPQSRASVLLSGELFNRPYENVEHCIVQSDALECPVCMHLVMQEVGESRVWREPGHAPQHTQP
jgi:hypothetical protein